MKTVIVIPAYNEERVIGKILDEIIKCQYHDVIVVDDGSGDKTAKIALETGATVLQHMINRGQGAALKTGMTCALDEGADIIVTFDADGQHLVSDIENLVEPIKNGEVSVTLGSRFLNNSAINIPKFRKFILNIAIVFTRVVSKMNITDTHNGLRAFSRDALSKINMKQDRMSHASEILDEINYKKISYKEVPVTIMYSEYSTTRPGENQSIFSFAKILFKYVLGRIMK
jgi:polyprenyl-phospho-N-acetylgalactosaminyl synthase